MSGLRTYRIAKKKKKEVPIITFNQSFQSPNQSERRSQIDSIIVHHTAGLFPGCAMWLCDLKAKASAHVIITTDGVIYKSTVTRAVPSWVSYPSAANNV